MRQESQKSSKQMRAKRLKLLRQMAGLTRQQVNDRYRVSFGNFQNWEGPRFGGLTERGARIMLDVCKEEGIEATLEWLMHGVEPGPRITERFYNKDKEKLVELQRQPLFDSNSEITAITRELLLFKHNYDQQVLEMMVSDDSMHPSYKVGEYVAGKIFVPEDFSKAINQDCIIELPDGNLILRTLKAGSNNKLFNLICSNLHASLPVIYDVEIISVAPVIWVRRKAC